MNDFTFKQSAKLESRIQDLESQKRDLECKVSEAEKKRDSLVSSLEESESSCSKLQSQVTQYRNVLSETVSYTGFSIQSRLKIENANQTHL